MKKISLNGISQRLSEKELKNVMGGSGNGCGTNALSIVCNGSSGCYTAYGSGVCKPYGLTCACHVG
jgi:bacteriocin-like protein